MKIYLVGGAVRDKLLGEPVKEKDWVVVGATVKDMLNLGFKQVGKEFPVFLHPETNEEYALARMERKVKPGYTGFEFDTSPQVTLEEDLLRRDLTINAMASDEQGNLIDPYQGKKDLAQHCLRHVSPAFAEDPVRILRIGRFLARYAHKGFKVAPETYALMRAMVNAGEVDALVAERVWKELERALGEKTPQAFFTVLAECGALAVLFPDITLDSANLQALIESTKITTDTTIRFSVLLHCLPKKAIQTLSNRYRIPNKFKELAVLTAEYHEIALTLYSDIINVQVNSSLPTALLHFFYQADVFRRESRFEGFLLCCDIIAKINHLSFDAKTLSRAANVAKSVDVQALLQQGLQGQALAHALRTKREQALSDWLNNKKDY